MRIIRGSIVLFVALMFVWSSGAAAQDWRGMGRLAGKVSDESGAPIEGVIVKARRVGSKTGPDVRTNKNGEFVLAGINGGRWNLDFEKSGYQTRQIAASVSEHGTSPPITATLRTAAVDPNVQIRDSLEIAAELVKQQKYADARAIYENILKEHPEASQVEPYIARTYYAERQLDPAIEHLRVALAKDADNIDVKVLLATVLAEKGNADESRQLIASIDDKKITDPSVMLNVGIGLLNQKHLEDAVSWFDKTVTRFPRYPEGYYYRGITEIQLLKTDAARTDLAKFLELAPNAAEAATARGILDRIKQ